MTFRTRLSLALGVVALMPLVGFGVAVRREMTVRLTGETDQRVLAVVRSVRGDLAAEIGSTRARLRSLATLLAGENRFRLATQSGTDRTWLLDWAGGAARAGGLDLLVVQDQHGRVVSSAHFRNEYDRVLPDPAGPIARAGAAALVVARTPEGSIRALATVDSFAVGAGRFTILGGRAFDSARVAQPAPDVSVRLALPGSAPPSETVARIPIAHFDAATGTVDSAWLMVTRDLAPVVGLRRTVDRFLLVALGSTLLAAVAVALWLGRRMAEPLASLAAKTEALDLDQLDQQFDTGRQDEIGSLARLLDAMTRRLRLSVSREREAERRATVGDLARQVNHDVKNGLAPIRNVVRHLAQAAEQEPARLAEIFRERRGTLESSVGYLENLAANYARLTPSPDWKATDPNAVMEAVARTVGDDRARVELELAPSLPPMRADPVVARRIVENLVGNAVDALESPSGRVRLATELVGDGPARRIRLTVADTGRGMSRDELDRAFQDFYTSKPGGTGLGLSVVRRLVADLGGSLSVETAPGRGSRFQVEIPAG